MYAIKHALHTHSTIYVIFLASGIFFFNRSKTCCFTTGFEILKNERKKGGGVVKKKCYPPIRFRKLHAFTKFQFYRSLEKCLKYIQKNFCCLKNIICTHLCTRLWHQGIIAISCIFFRENFRFAKKDTVPDVLH